MVYVSLLRRCRLLPAALTLITVLAVFSLAPVTTNAAEPTPKSGALYTKYGPPIQDHELRAMLDYFISEKDSALIAFTQCFGGDCVDNFASMTDTHVISATSPGQKAKYGGFDDDAAEYCRPDAFDGVPETSSRVFDTGRMGSSTAEVPIQAGTPVSLGRIGIDEGAPASRHVLFYAGYPDQSKYGTYSDQKIKDTLQGNFAGKPNTTYTTVGGLGVADGYDYPGTMAGLMNALSSIKLQMNENEQFILFCSDHGILMSHAAVTPPAEVLPGPGASTNVTLIMEPDLLDQLHGFTGNEDTCGIDVYGAKGVDMTDAWVDQCALEVPEMLESVSASGFSMFDLDGDGHTTGSEEYGIVHFQIPFDDLIPWQPGNYPLNGDNQVEYTVMIYNDSPSETLSIGGVALNGGGVPKDGEEGGSAMAGGTRCAALSTKDKEPIFSFDVVNMLNKRIPHYHSALVMVMTCAGGSFAQNFSQMQNTHVIASTTGYECGWYSGYNDDAIDALCPFLWRTSAYVHYRGKKGKDSREHPSERGEPVSLDKPRPGNTEGLPESRHILFWAGLPDGDWRMDDDDLRDQVKKNFKEQPYTSVTTVGGEGTADGYDYPGTRSGLDQAIKALSLKMNEKEQMILIFADHGMIAPVNKASETGSAGKSMSEITPEGEALLLVASGDSVTVDYELEVDDVELLLGTSDNDSDTGVILFFDSTTAPATPFADGDLTITPMGSATEYSSFTEAVIDYDDSGVADTEDEYYQMLFVIPKAELLPFTPGAIPATEGIVDISIELENNTGSDVTVSFTTLNSGPLPLGSDPLSDVSLAATPGPSAPPAMSFAAPGDHDIPMLQANLAATDGPADVTGVTIASSGLGDETTQITNVEVWHDSDGDGTPDGGSALASDVHLWDNGALTLDFAAPLAIADGASETLLVTYDLAPLGAYVPQSNGKGGRLPTNLPFIPIAAAVILPLFGVAIRKKHLGGIALLLVASAAVGFAACGGGGGSTGSLSPTIANSTEYAATHESAGFKLSVLEDCLLDNGQSRFELQVTEEGAETVVEINAAGASNLKALYCDLAYDPEQYTPAGMSATGLLGDSEDVLELAVTSDRGEVHYGQVLANWNDRPGFAGEGTLAVARFVRGSAPGTKLVSTPPTSAASQALLGWESETGTLSWGYYNQGDYDQNSEVNIADLTPLGQNFQATGPFDPDSALSVIDGDANGELNIADLTPIGNNFGNMVAEYRVYESTEMPSHTASKAASADVLETVPFGDATGDPVADRLQFSYIVDPVDPEMYYWVVPTDGDTEGTPSTLGGDQVQSFMVELTAVHAKDAADAAILVTGLPLGGTLLQLQ